MTVEEPGQAAIIESIHSMLDEVRKYVPGYVLKNGPVFGCLAC
jgi:acetaldehyde/propanal dehydrogenase